MEKSRIGRPNHNKGSPMSPETTKSNIYVCMEIHLTEIAAEALDIGSAKKMIRDFAEGFKEYFENGSVFER